MWVIETDKIKADAKCIFVGVCLVKPNCADDKALIRHEEVHSEQIVNSWGLMPLLYLIKSWRLRYEAEAYAEQIKASPKVKQVALEDFFATTLANNYNLGISKEEAAQAIKEYL